MSGAAVTAEASSDETAVSVPMAAPMYVPAKTLAEDPDIVAARDRLNSLLDGIDSNKRKRDDGSDVAVEDSMAPATPYEWRKIFDPASKNYYYYNHRTSVTQWEVPAAFVEVPKEPQADYTAVASFSSKNGAFASGGASTYWEQVNSYCVIAHHR